MGLRVATIALAVNDEWQDKTTGQKQEKVEFVKVEAFGKQAETLAQYAGKGTRLFVQGRMETRKFQDQQTGEDRKITEIKMNGFQFLDSKPSEGGSQGGAPQQPAPQQPAPQQPQPQPQQPQQPAPTQQPAQPQQPQGGGGGYPGDGQGVQGDMEDDIPFAWWAHHDTTMATTRGMARW